MIPAKKGDIIKKIYSHYENEIKDGEHFVVLDVFNGDDTAIVLLPNGELGSLCFPEEYEVVGTADDKITAFRNAIPVIKKTNYDINIDKWLSDLISDKTLWIKELQKKENKITEANRDEKN